MPMQMAMQIQIQMQMAMAMPMQLTDMLPSLMLMPPERGLGLTDMPHVITDDELKSLFLVHCVW
jgi:hypothetical protein